MKLRFARAATKHRVGHASSRYVIEHSGAFISQSPGEGAPAGATTRRIYLGDDETGEPLEIIAVELSPGVLLVIHAMRLREKYRKDYEEAKRWRL